MTDNSHPDQPTIDELLDYMAYLEREMTEEAANHAPAHNAHYARYQTLKSQWEAANEELTARKARK